MFEDRSHEKEDTTLNPEEQMISIKRGVNSIPWHPGTMGAPYVYKVTLLGACNAGKSSIAHRLVAHTFDPSYRATRTPSQLFWRHAFNDADFAKMPNPERMDPFFLGRDIMVELEDTPGITPEISPSGELQARGRYEVEQLLKPLCWFEKLRKDKEATKADPSAESNPLLPGPGGGPRVTSAVSGRKAKAANSGLAGIKNGMSTLAGDMASSFGECVSRLSPDMPRAHCIRAPPLAPRAPFTHTHTHTHTRTHTPPSHSTTRRASR